MIPDWSRHIRSLYLSGAANQFILHGNVEDRLVLPEHEEGFALGDLHDFLTGYQLRKFDVLFTYDLGHGLRVTAMTDQGRNVLDSWPSRRGNHPLPKAPRDGILYIDHFLRYAANLRNLGPDAEGDPHAQTSANLNIGVIIRDASLVLPHRSTLGGTNYEVHSAASLVRSWSTETDFMEQNLATFLVAENLNDLHPLVGGNPRVATVAVPLPSEEELRVTLEALASRYPAALPSTPDGFARPAARLAGASLSSVEALVKERHHREAAITGETLTELKKQLVEKDCRDLIEFVEPDRSLDRVQGHDAVKNWLRQDIHLWNQDDLRALPMGYLFCGPVGTGKTFLGECLAGEAGVPVVKFRNFRDRWVGSTEGNLERIFTLLHALGRCLVFIDEADQALGSRTGNAGDSGISGRVYSMMAKEMSNPRNRGRIIWALASSRPDLIEVDLKRPGRIDVKLPLFPTINGGESYELLRMLASRQGVSLPETAHDDWAHRIPAHLTPGGAESIAVKLYRLVRTTGLDPAEAFADILADYQDPIPRDVMDFQIQLAIREASDLAFVPTVFRASGEDPS